MEGSGAADVERVEQQWNGENKTRRKGENKQQVGEGRLLGSLSLLDKLFIIFIARKQKISRERGRRLDQSTEECEFSRHTSSRSSTWSQEKSLEASVLQTKE